MDFEPSNRTAAAAGLWSALGLVALDVWLDHNKSASPLSNNLAWFLVLALFLYVPGYFLVVGAGGTRFGRAWLSDATERRRYLAVVKRVLVWLVCAGVAAAGLTALLKSAPL